MVYKRRKFVSYRLKYYRIPISKITNKLKLGETIIVSTPEGNKLLSYRGICGDMIEFLEIKDFLHERYSRAINRRKDRKDAENDPFVQYIQNLKIERGCENPNCKCRGINFEHYEYDFDHIDKNKKTEDICKLIGRYKISSMPKTKEKVKQLILEELKNCQILCVVCHRDKSYKEKNGDHVCLSNYNSIEEFLVEKGLSPEPKYLLPLEDFIISS